jgi:hypothetical protein
MFTNVGSMGRFKKINSVIIADVFEGLVSRWNFEEASGTTVADSWGSNNGTASGGMTREVGKIGDYSGGFDGIDDVVDLPTLGVNDTNQAFSITAWIKLLDIVGGKVIFANNSPQLSDTGETSIGFRIVHEYIRFDLGKAQVSGVHVETSNVLTAGNWIHVAATYDGGQNDSGASIFINGVQNSIRTGSSCGLADTQIDDWKIGHFGGSYASGGRFEGDIDDVRFYNRDLSASEVSRIYNKYA